MAGDTAKVGAGGSCPQRFQVGADRCYANDGLHCHPAGPAHSGEWAHACTPPRDPPVPAPEPGPWPSALWSHASHLCCHLLSLLPSCSQPLGGRFQMSAPGKLRRDRCSTGVRGRPGDGTCHPNAVRSFSCKLQCQWGRLLTGTQGFSLGWRGRSGIGWWGRPHSSADVLTPLTCALSHGESCLQKP